MTIRTPSSTDSHHASSGDAMSPSPSVTGQVRPYAQPQTTRVPETIDAVLIDAIRAAAGPYVAAPWRAPHSAASAAEIARAFATTPTPSLPRVESVDAPLSQTAELPWIDAYLDASTEAPVASANDESAAANSTESVQANLISRDTSHEVEPSFEATVAASHEAAIEATSHTPAAPELSDDGADTWPLAEAGDAMRELADQLSSHDVPSHAPPIVNADQENSLEPLFAVDAPAPSVKPLPMWSDDDLMDIMPVTHQAPADAGEQHWAAQARRDAQRDARASDDIESAARVLETLAKRVRDGDLQISGYSPEMSEAAAVAAALASLLNTRQ